MSRIGRRAMLAGGIAALVAPAAPELVVELVPTSLLPGPFFGVDRTIHPSMLAGWRPSPASYCAMISELQRSMILNAEQCLRLLRESAT
jgi:hypothetical protein